MKSIRLLFFWIFMRTDQANALYSLLYLKESFLSLHNTNVKYNYIQNNCLLRSIKISLCQLLLSRVLYSL